MKKILLLAISIMMVTATFARTGNPIPSFNVPVSNKAYFQEDNSVLGTPPTTREKRDMNVTNEGSAGNGKSIGNDWSVLVVYIFSLDGSTKLGPFSIPVGQTLSIPIDGSDWGVIAETNTKTFMSVWTN